jgi:hypothetical protein
VESKRFGNEIVLRLDEDDEIVSSVEKACKAQVVTSARVSGIGAMKKAKLRVLNSAGDGFCFYDIDERMEIANITGNITRDGDGIMVHLHLSAANGTFKLVGGHIVSCTVTNTAEIFITEVSGDLSRAEKAEGLLRRMEFNSKE